MEFPAGQIIPSLNQLALNWSRLIRKNEEGELNLKRKMKNRQDQTVDLKHMDLWLDVDFEKEQVHGKSRIFLEPHFYPMDTLKLDAKFLGIKSCRLSGDSSETRFSYDSLVLRIPLPVSYLKGQLISVEMKYVSRPAYARRRYSESLDGLYFVTSDVGKEIWSQNETVSASSWFPTAGGSQAKVDPQYPFEGGQWNANPF